jgi:predicted DsbA family dithiol-disulfide isomerase
LKLVQLGGFFMTCSVEVVSGIVIDVYLDLICPWCLIGKRYLDEALETFGRRAPHTDVQVRWHSVQLLPDVPAQGYDFNAFYLKRLGGEQPLRQRQRQVNAAASRAGFQIDFSNIPRMPNTLQAHQLLNFASGRLPAVAFAALLEHLFAAHFSGGADLGDRATLCRIAQSHSLDTAALQAWIADGAGQPLPLDVPGVPFFVFNRQLALSGAQPPQILLDAMQRACTELQNSPHASALTKPAL